MCEQCEKIDAQIAYYAQRLTGVQDRTAIGLFKLLIEDLESDKASLHAQTEDTERRASAPPTHDAAPQQPAQQQQQPQPPESKKE